MYKVKYDDLGLELKSRLEVEYPNIVFSDKTTDYEEELLRSECNANITKINSWIVAKDCKIEFNHRNKIVHINMMIVEVTNSTWIEQYYLMYD